MKSIMEEGTSIIKAIEKAWYRANKPFEFSVKIFEQEEKNFIGITTKQAKIGIFFKENEEKLLEKRTKQYPPSQEVKKTGYSKKESNKFQKTTQLPKIGQWTGQMVTHAEKWVKTNLTLMGLPNVQFNTAVSNNYLTFYFNIPLVSDAMKEKILFRSFAHLIMVSLRNKFKTDFRPLRIILTRT